MRHGWWLVLLLLAGCEETRRCEFDRNCLGGEICEAGVCRVVGGGGAGGGTGGGTQTGGGTGADDAGCAQSVIDGCAGWQECIPTESGGYCESAGYELTWVTPAEAQPSRMSSVTGRVTVTKADGGAVLLTSLPVSGAPAFAGANGNYTGALPLGAPEGVKTFLAGWEDGGPFEARTVVYDVTEPEVTLSVEARPTSLGDVDQGGQTHWKKDEWAVVVVRVDGGLPATASNVRTTWDGGVRDATASCPTSCMGTCRCFEVEVAGAPLAAFRDAVPFRVEGVADEAGNVAGVASSTINVTRFKWERALAVNGGASLRQVGVSEDGVVVWAADTAGGAVPKYTISTFKQDGSARWSAQSPDGSVGAGPVVGRTDVWFGDLRTDLAVLDTPGLASFSLASGSVGPRACVALSSAAFSGDMALSRIGTQDIPLAIRDGEIKAYANGDCRSFGLSPAPVDATQRPSLVALSRDGGTEAFVAYENGGTLWKATLAGSVWNTGNGTTTLPSGVQPRALFQDGLAFVGGGGVAGNGSFFSLPSAGTLPAMVASSVAASNAGPAAVGQGYLVYGDNAGAIRRDIYMGGNLLDGGVVVTSTGLGNLQSTTPVIGEGALIYFASLNGAVSARRASDLSEVWRFTPAVTGNAVAQPALDVYRGASGAKDCSKPLGVYYQLVRSGSTATLRAILVDSRGLDDDAPWPKYQRDNANTGNAALSLAPWSCP